MGKLRVWGLAVAQSQELKLSIISLFVNADVATFEIQIITRVSLENCVGMVMSTLPVSAVRRMSFVMSASHYHGSPEYDWGISSIIEWVTFPRVYSLQDYFFWVRSLKDLWRQLSVCF
ncbi:hypothetical protein Pfo_014886 [Paulownia fortunei]|nr:hypothetical protein Pfo_014886 [Paulownia fortunei]